jgi:selenide,water dikinase
MTASTDSKMKHIVLVGGGHAHAQVIKAFHRLHRPSNVNVSLVDTQASAWYSGMIPGCVAGIYHPDQTKIHLKPLADWASVTFYEKEVVDIDPDERKLYLKGETDDDGPTVIDFDVVSLDIGSTAVGANEEWQQHVIATRPISKLVSRMEEAEQKFDADDSSKNHIRIVIVGGGAAGIELALATRARWDKFHPNFSITIVDRGAEIMPTETEMSRKVLKDALEAKGIEMRHRAYTKEVHADHLVLDDGTTLEFTHCIWAAGAAAHDLANVAMRKRGIAVTDKGWIRVSPTMQSISHDCIFAAGDCVTIEDLPRGHNTPPKAGVYAVRAGPLLVENLVRYVQEHDKPLDRFMPQDNFIKLIIRGDGHAIGLRFGFAMTGPWVMQLKDQIDRKFVSLFAEENLPSDEEMQNESNRAVKQYDDQDTEEEQERLEPKQAAMLLLRSDDGVDVDEASRVLRLMRDDESYRNAILPFILE